MDQAVSAISVTINGTKHTFHDPPDRLLLWVLRNELGLTGAKYGCGEGQCGACTVLLDGSAIRSCQLTVAAVAGKSITTIEGLSDGERLHPLQQSFIACDAMQCGYCTAGMILSSASLLHKNPTPSDAEIIADLQGNICRCGTYHRIIAAVQQAAKAMAASQEDRLHARV